MFGIKPLKVVIVYEELITFRHIVVPGIKQFALWVPQAVDGVQMA